MKIEIYHTKTSDIATIIAMENDSENAQFISPNTKQEHLALIQDDNVDHLMLKMNSRTIGFVVLTGKKNRNRSLEFRRIVINEKGRGYGRLAIKKIIQYSFEELNAHRLWLDVLENNARARHLYLSEGFTEEGKLRDCLFRREKFESLIVMSILSNEFDSN